MNVPQTMAQPRVVEFEGGSSPLKLHFKNGASNVQMTQSHAQGGQQQEQMTSQEEEPIRMVHEVKKPVIQVRDLLSAFYDVF